VTRRCMTVSRENHTTTPVTAALVAAFAARWREGRINHRYGCLILVVGPKIILPLRSALDATTAALVTLDLASDLGEIPEQDLPEVLAVAL